MDFADDFVLLWHTQEQMRANSSDLHHLSEYVGLRMHPAKSKVFITVSQRKDAKLKVGH